jgi:hypothetical protein
MLQQSAYPTSPSPALFSGGMHNQGFMLPNRSHIDN